MSVAISQVPPMKQVTWPQVILVLGLSTLLLTAVIILSIMNKDVGAVLAAVAVVLLSVLGVFGVDARNKLDHKMDQVKEISNGRLTDALYMVEKLQAQVTAFALSQPPPPPEQEKK